jgi:hypothetical protein
MSDQAWALQALFKYRLKVDFSQQTIGCSGYTCGWYWDDMNVDFYQALSQAITDIEKSA